MASKKKSAGLLFDEVLPQAKRTARSLLSLDPQEDVPASQQALEMALGFVPGIGQAMALRDIERARRANDPAAAAMAAASFVPFGRLAGLGKKAGPVMSELDVYHGSPHRFDEFDASKIGTGEGAQAYGHGIYLAESPDVAKSYQTALASERGFRFGDKTNLTRQEVQDLVNAQYPGYLDDVARPSLVADYVMDDMVTGLIRPEGKVPRQFKPGSEREKLFKQLQKEISHADKGALYTADLPDEMVDRMLDWDKPLKEQSAEIKKIAAMMGVDPDDPEIRGSGLQMELTYRERKKALADIEANPDLSAKMPNYEAIVAERLRQAGIPGIKYRDAGSRGQGGTGTRNFVVFPGEEKKVKILKRE